MPPTTTAQPQAGVYRRLAEWHGELTAFRRDLHAHPELGFEERRTAARVAEALRVAGVDEVHEGIGKTGVVALIFVVINLVVDLLYFAVDPRLRIERSGAAH